MEARLIHAHKVHTIDSEMREWRIINPLKLGIRVDESQVPSEYTGFFNANIRPDVSHFLTEIAGQGGLWGRLDAMVFVRKERTAEESGGEGFEMVEEKKELKDEDFRVE